MTLAAAKKPNIEELPSAPKGNLADNPATDRPLRVCFIIDELGTGGTETQLLRMIDCFDRRKVEPYLCLLNGLSAASQELIPLNCPVTRLGVRSLLSHQALRQAWKFAKLLREWKIDILQTHFPDSTYFGVPVARWAGVPRVVRTRRDLFYWVTPRHRRWGRYLDRFYNRLWIDAIMVNSEAVRNQAIVDEYPLRLPINVIHNGLDLSAYATCDNLQRFKATVQVGVVAMLRREKRLDIFLRAARFVADAYPHVKFIIAGEGPERPRLEQLIDELDLSAYVELRGRVNNIAEFLSALDIGVLCSESEGLPNAVIEYMAAGIPVVATNVGGIPELVEEGETGLLVPSNDAKSLSQAIARLIDEPATRKKMGDKARTRAHSEYDMESIITTYQEYYRKVALSAS